MKTFYKVLFAAGLILCASCSRQNEGYTPGNWVNLDAVRTYPGGEVLISGQASSIAGISTVSLLCKDFGLNQVYDLAAQAPKVFNYNYRITVPEDAVFSDGGALRVIVKGVDGVTCEKQYPITFLPDSEAPKYTNWFADNVYVDSDAAGKAAWSWSLGFTDNRGLQSLRFEIPEIGLDRLYTLDGLSGQAKDVINFSAMGKYAAKVTLKDLAGNMSILEPNVFVAPAEAEQKFVETRQLYFYYASEKSSDYIDGFWHYMTRTASNCYSARIYVPKDNTEVYFVAEANDNNLYVIGASQYRDEIGNKLMYNSISKVKPVLMETKGYYTIYVKPLEHTLEVQTLDISTAFQGELYPCACGMSNVSDWALPADPMDQEDDYVYACDMTQDGTYVSSGKGEYRAYSYSTKDWQTSFRCWQSASGEGWYKAEYGDNTSRRYSSDYNGKIRMYVDTALPYGWIKKAQ